MLQAEEAALAGPEGRAGTDDYLAVRVWLRLLSSSLQIEGEIRKRLRAPSEPSAQDQRAVRMRLTALGLRAFARRAREHKSRVHKLLQGPSPAALQALHDPLGRLRTRLTARSAGGPAARRKGAR